MIKQIRRPIFTFIGISLVSFALSGCIVHVNAKSKSHDNDEISYTSDLKTTNKSIKVSDGRSVDDITSVNGSIRIKDKVTARHISNTNGQIKIGDKVQADSVAAVNGQIKIGDGFVSNGDVSTVNGQIKIDEESQIGGEVSSVNGSIRLEGVVVELDVVTVNGNIELKDGSHVKGNIHFRHRSNNSYRRNNPVLFISADSQVDGDIILEQEVDLELENKSLKSKVKRLYKE